MKGEKPMFPFKTALNASTLFPFQLTILEQIEVAKQAGYDGIELWMRNIEDFLANGGTVQGIKAALEESNLSFINAITFFKWADANREIKENALEQAEKEMRLLKSLGCTAIAAPPFGNVAEVPLEDIASDFNRLADIGRKIGIEPILEFWGKAAKLSTLKEAQLILAKANRESKVLIDPFHMHLGGSSLFEIKRMHANEIGVVHVNDYPDNPSREKLEDRHRVFPGEGISPTKEMANILAQIEYKGFLSLELFIEDYQGKSALEVARYGLETMKKAYTVDA